MFLKLEYDPHPWEIDGSTFSNQNFTPMVTTEVGQLASECNAWRDTLRSFRDQFTQFKSQLQSVAGKQSNREVLLEIEHLDNQFHIQLINIHDLKQKIKMHIKKVGLEKGTSNGHISDETLAEHENLYDEFQTLEATLQELKAEFESFTEHVH